MIHLYATMIYGVNFGQINPLEIIAENLGIDNPELSVIQSIILKETQVPDISGIDLDHLEKTYPIRVSTYHKNSDPYYILGLRNHEYWVSFSNLFSIPEEKLLITENDKNILCNFMHRYGLKPMPLMWHLCSFFDD